MKVAFITHLADFQFDFFSICAMAMAEKYPQGNFALFFRKQPDESISLNLPGNLSLVHLEDQNESDHFFQRMFSGIKRKKQIKKFEPDFVFIQNDDYKDDQTKLIFLLDPIPSKFKRSLLTKMNKASKILTYQREKNDLSRYGISADNQIVIDPIVSRNKRETQDLGAFREQHLEGHDFFLLFVDNMENAVVFLKGFSQFKQWQKSQIRLAMVVPESMEREMKEKLSHYKHRESVCLLNNSIETDDAVREAFGNFIWQQNMAVESNLLRAASLENPLFLPDDSFWRNLFLEKADFFEPKEKSIFSMMTQLYKETLPIRDRAANRIAFISYHEAHITLQSIGKLLEP